MEHRFFQEWQSISTKLGWKRRSTQLVLAERYPKKTLLESILKARVLAWLKTAVETGLHNVSFIRTQIELINHVFAKTK
jgi:tRNA (guanine-N7-)-methyltransferase